MTIQSENLRNKALVDEYFKAGVQGHLTSFAAYLHPGFTVHRTMMGPTLSIWGSAHNKAFRRRIEFPIVGTRAAVTGLGSVNCLTKEDCTHG